MPNVVGLTATPGKQTFGLFWQNLVSEYTYPQSVAEDVGGQRSILIAKGHPFPMTEEG